MIKTSLLSLCAPAYLNKYCGYFSTYFTNPLDPRLISIQARDAGTVLLVGEKNENGSPKTVRHMRLQVTNGKLMDVVISNGQITQIQIEGLGYVHIDWTSSVTGVFRIRLNDGTLTDMIHFAV